MIASLFFDEHYKAAIDKLYEYKITPEDFFGFVDYHYDDDHEDEDLTEMFTDDFIDKVTKDYLLKCKSEDK